MTRRTIWVQAHPRRLPDRIDTRPHAELLEARRFDQTIAVMQAQIAAEIDREFLGLPFRGMR